MYLLKDCSHTWMSRWIIWDHNLAFWSSDTFARECAKFSNSTDAVTIPNGCDPVAMSKETSIEPPFWVLLIMVSQAISFGFFGFVQIYQFVYPQNRMEAEYAYIVLSVVAKSILGWSIGSGLFFRN